MLRYRDRVLEVRGERVPSMLTTVQWSGIVRVPGFPTFTIGSIAIVNPGCSLTPRFGFP